MDGKVRSRRGHPCCLCNRQKRQHPDLVFHVFPKDKGRCCKWLDAIKVPRLEEKSFEQLNKSISICSNHFSPKNYATGKPNSTLLQNACPDQNLIDTSGTPSSVRRTCRTSNTCAKNTTSIDYVPDPNASINVYDEDDLNLGIDNPDFNEPKVVKRIAARVTNVDEMAYDCVLKMGDGSYKCNICGKIYIKKIHINRHMVVHAGQIKHCCKLCPMEFGLQSDLHKHTHLHSGRTVYECEICDKHFSQSSGLSQHRALHKEKNLHKCNMCFKQYTHRSSLERHVMVHDLETFYGCGECKQQFTDKTEFLTHVQRKECKTSHKQWKVTHVQGKECKKSARKRKGNDVTSTVGQNSELKESTSELQSLNCKICFKKFTYINGLYRHYHALHPEVKYDSRSYEAQIAIKEDALSEFKESKSVTVGQNSKFKESTSESQLLKCKICLKEFAYINGLYRHYHALHPEVNCGCRSCETQTAVKEDTYDNLGIEHVEIFPEAQGIDHQIKSELKSHNSISVKQIESSWFDNNFTINKEKIEYKETNPENEVVDRNIKTEIEFEYDDCGQQLRNNESDSGCMADDIKTEAEFYTYESSNIFRTVNKDANIEEEFMEGNFNELKIKKELM